MRSYKSYFALILVPYLFLIFIFHTQLQLYDVPEPEEEDREEAFLLRRQNHLAIHHAELHNESSPHQHKFSRRRNLSHENSMKWNPSAEELPENQKEDPNHFHNAFQQSNNIAKLNFNVSFPDLSFVKVPTPTRFPYAQHSYCDGITAPLDSHSVNFQHNKDCYIYTAYYDDRRDGNPFIRIITVIRKIDRKAVFCHIPKEPSGKSGYESVIATYYEMCENHGKDYGGWILSCEMPDTIRHAPCEVVVSMHSSYKRGQTEDYKIPVFLLQNEEAKKQDFAICVPPLFGYIPSTTLIEFVELSKILGANHLIFYAHHIPREIQKVLHYYESTGAVTVIPWDLPIKDKAVWYHGQLVAINDCLYRNMHRFTYLAFNDIDEFVVPHRHFNWSDMMAHLHNKSDANSTLHSGYSFQSAFFDPLIESSSRVLYDLESDLRTKSFSKVRTKVMVDAVKIYELGIHHISRPIKVTQKPVYVEPEIAFLHHYRKCITDFDPRMNCQVFARDESISRYIPNLRHNVHRTLWILKETEKLSYRDRYMLKRWNFMNI